MGFKETYLNKRAKKTFFGSTNRKAIYSWDAIKPQFSDKSNNSGERVQLLEDDDILILITSDK